MIRSVLSAAIVGLLFAACSSSPPAEEIRAYPVQITNLGAAVNSSQDEFAPSITANATRLFFTRGNTRIPHNQRYCQSSKDN